MENILLADEGLVITSHQSTFGISLANLTHVPYQINVISEIERLLLLYENLLFCNYISLVLIVSCFI